MRLLAAVRDRPAAPPEGPAGSNPADAGGANRSLALRMPDRLRRGGAGPRFAWARANSCTFRSLAFPRRNSSIGAGSVPASHSASVTACSFPRTRSTTQQPLAWGPPPWQALADLLRAAGLLQQVREQGEQVPPLLVVDGTGQGDGVRGLPDGVASNRAEGVPEEAAEEVRLCRTLGNVIGGSVGSGLHDFDTCVAELLVFVWMPLMLLFGERLMNGQNEGKEQRSKLPSVVGLAAIYGAFLWSHPPTAYQFTLGFGVYVLVLCLMRREWKGLAAVGASMALGIGLAAMYLLPAAIEQDYIHREYVAETWPYHKTYIFVHDLYKTDVHSGFFKLIDATWITGTAVIAIGAITLLWLKRQSLTTNPALKQRVVLWVILGGLASFMMTSASMPVGKLIPKLDIGVFSWRMLSITTLVVALLAGSFTQAAVNAAGRGLRADRLLFATLAALVIVGGAGMSAVAVARPMSDAAVFEPEPEHLNWATIPSTAPADPTELPEDVPQVALAMENGEAVVETWKPEHRVVRVSLSEDDTLLIRTFNFPGWTAAVNGQPVPIKSSKDWGSIEIGLQPGTHRVTLDFLDTAPRRSFRLVSLSSFVVLLALSGSSVIRRRNLKEELMNRAADETNPGYRHLRLRKIKSS